VRRLFFATIAILPCVVAAFTQQRISDRKVDLLKGKVQKVITESAKLTNESGEWVEGERLPDAIVTYDSEGNLVRRDVYWKGNLSDIYEYSFLEGERVVKITRVGPDDSVGGGPGPKAPPDPRYTLKFKYKYDNNGNRTEELWYGNDTSLRSRKVYVYDEKGNRIESFSYIPGARNPSLRVVSVYDAKGNVIEETYFRANNPVGEKWSYVYEFDFNGNWIKRKRMQWITKDGQSYFEPHDVGYRSITYF
jgi:antitoxin component YwqK of YwqJK toxin-antitoxin module